MTARREKTVARVLGLVALAATCAWSQGDAGLELDAGLADDPRVAQVRELIAGTLDVSVPPRALFDVTLDDEAAVQIEASRVRALLRANDDALRVPERPPRVKGRPVPIEPVDAGLRAELVALDRARWNQRLDLDRARLDFYELDPARRAALLLDHARRQEAAQPRVTEEELRAREAEAERAKALEAARRARSEAERTVAEETARLVALETSVRALRETFQQRRDEIAVRRDAVLGWQRRVREANAAGPTQADGTYDALRRALRSSRDDLASALDALDADTVVPGVGADPIAELPADIAADDVRDRRAAVERVITEVRRDERALEDDWAAALLDEINALNRERLGLLPGLSPDKQDDITGFTGVGWDQARSEARHLSLILRYHQHVARAWLRGGSLSAWQTTSTLVPLLLLLGAFVWGRRRTLPLLRWLERKTAADDRRERRSSPSPGNRAVRLLLKTHRTLEWIVFALVGYWLLPTGAHELLEVQLIASVLTWSLAGALVVNTINALASTPATATSDEGHVGALRLRSLRLVGRTITVFVLILVLSARLVGRGTIFSWVFSTCWFAAVPLFLVLVRWWRQTVFERLDRVRKKSPLQAWILANRSGWKSFAAATLGAVQLFATGSLKVARSWLSGFDLARRVHAWLFKRELARIGEGQGHAELVPLARETFARFDPETPCERWLACPADELRKALVARAQAGTGALVVVVGPRGMGKTSLLRAVARDVGEAKLVRCDARTGLEVLRDTHASAPPVVLVDDAQTLVEARIGGLARFDEAVAFARAHSATTSWVFAIDASVWPLLARARDARPMFDETHVLHPWDEGQLGALVVDRCQAAGLTPQYDTLLERLPPGADEIDRQDALRAKRAGYDRMLWDHVGGNPGLALEAWRVSLGQDAAGLVHVRPLQVPDLAKLERLPDSSLFVLRAVLQLAPTTVETVAQATRLRPEEVLQDLRFGKAQGFYEDDAGHFRIAWHWLLAVSRLLERRHLLVNP